jgi:hypothetical protein
MNFKPLGLRPIELDKSTNACLDSSNLRGASALMVAMDDDLANLTREDLIAEVMRLRGPPRQ